VQKAERREAQDGRSGGWRVVQPRPEDDDQVMGYHGQGGEAPHPFQGRRTPGRRTCRFRVRPPELLLTSSSLPARHRGSVPEGSRDRFQQTPPSRKQGALGREESLMSAEARAGGTSEAAGRRPGVSWPWKGLRGLAALAVVAHHLIIVFWPWLYYAPSTASTNPELHAAPFLHDGPSRYASSSC